LAYYGVMKGDDASLLAACELLWYFQALTHELILCFMYIDDQIRLYRQYLTNGTGLWRHIMLGTQIADDLGYWATGNAWAAWGSSRVLASFMQPAYKGRYDDLKANLHTWTVQTLTDSFAYLDVSPTLLYIYIVFRETCADDLISLPLAYFLIILGKTSSLTHHQRH
jgi:hypothetical protein